MESESYAEMCRDNLETALAHLNLFMPANKENIEALLLGVRPIIAPCVCLRVLICFVYM